MKEGTTSGIRLENKKEEKQTLNAEEERNFGQWDYRERIQLAARSLLNIVYFYKRELFGLLYVLVSTGIFA